MSWGKWLERAELTANEMPTLTDCQVVACLYGLQRGIEREGKQRKLNRDSNKSVRKKVFKWLIMQFISGKKMYIVNPIMKNSNYCSLPPEP